LAEAERFKDTLEAIGVLCRVDPLEQQPKPANKDIPVQVGVEEKIIVKEFPEITGLDETSTEYLENSDQGLLQDFRKSFSLQIGVLIGTGVIVVTFVADWPMILIPLLAYTIWVYRDVTYLRIGKIPHRKELLNRSADEWTLASLFLFPIAFPVYLFNRSKLKQMGTEFPQTSEVRRIKLIGLIVSFLASIVLANFLISLIHHRNIDRLASEHQSRIEVKDSVISDSLLQVGQLKSQVSKLKEADQYYYKEFRDSANRALSSGQEEAYIDALKRGVEFKQKFPLSTYLKEMDKLLVELKGELQQVYFADFENALVAAKQANTIDAYEAVVKKGGELMVNYPSLPQIDRVKSELTDVRRDLVKLTKEIPVANAREEEKDRNKNLETKSPSN
jgi:hypothetical protein